MTVSSVHTSNFYQAQSSHQAGCSCPNCCQNESGQNEKPSLQQKEELDATQRQEVALLQQRDSEVRAHEAAHIAAGGSVVSGSASFTYQKGPDGKLYAVGGEVPISSPGGSTPEEKLRIAQQIQASALAPASPSPQDLKVASSAVMMEMQARQELREKQTEQMKAKAIQAYSKQQSSLEAQ